MVFSPLLIGQVEIPNRVVRTAHGTGYARPDITDDFIAFHVERAKGGCGLTILEAGAVHPSTKLEWALFRDNLVSDYRRLMTAIRPHGMRVFQQLWHGGNLYPGYDGPPLAVSTVPSFTGMVGRPMSDGEVHEIVQAFARCAGRAQEGGLDGVELHAGHGYLIQQFLSPLSNTRSDRWGGDFEGRMRFLMETLRAMRANVGKDFPIGIRLSSSQAPGGISEQDNRQILAVIQDAGLIDFVNVSQGDYFRMETMIGAMHNPTGYELPSARQVLEVSSVPRIVAGRFRTLEDVEQVLREGLADLVSMARAHIADPQIVNKTRAGKIDEVRPCISCNQGCVGGQLRGGNVGCLVNPAVGFESTLSEGLIQPSSAPRKILVIGGGAAGMEAARVAALLGHKVTLAEATPHLGGMIGIARRAPKLHTLGDIAYWLEQEVYRLGVAVRLSSYMTADDVRMAEADVVIVATGSMPRMDGFLYDNPGEPIRGTNLPHVISSVDLFTSPSRITAKTALVCDTVGHYETIAVVEHLLGQGAAVTLLTPMQSMTPYVQSTLRDVPALERFYKAGDFTSLTRHRLIEIQGNRCIVQPAQAGVNRRHELPADMVVLISPNEPVRDLFDELRDEIPEIYLVGDARSPRDVQAAIAEGHRTARLLR